MWPKVFSTLSRSLEFAYLCKFVRPKMCFSKLSLWTLSFKPVTFDVQIPGVRVSARFCMRRFVGGGREMM